MKAKKQKREPSPPKVTSTEDLCKDLVSIAALHVDDEKSRQVIYAAVKLLQQLDAVAREAGILPANQ